MEVMQYLKEEFDKKKESVHQIKDEVEDVIEDALLARQSRRSNGASATDEGCAPNAGVVDATCEYKIVDVSLDAEMKSAGFVEGDDNINEDESKKSVYSDESEGMWKCQHCIWTYQIGNPWVDHNDHQKRFTFGCRDALQEGYSHEEKLLEVEAPANTKLKDVDIDIQKVLSAVINGNNVEILKDSTASIESIRKETDEQHLKIDIVDESDEEVLELEFERAVEKMHTHEYNMYCPNCSSRITKVILRRRKREKRTDPQDLLGCLSCFSIFIPKEEGHRSKEIMVLKTLFRLLSPGNILDPLNVFGTRNRPQDSTVQQQRTQVNGANQPVKPNNNASFGSSGYANEGSVLNNGISNTEGSTSNGSLVVNIPDKLDGTTQGKRHGMKTIGEIEEGQNFTNGQYPGAGVQFPHAGSVPSETPQIENMLDTYVPLLAREARISSPWEILKSIVYGGLMELITSMSIVSSAAASHATTLNIVALGVAHLIGGLLVLFHNLKELKYEETNEENGEAKSRYLKLLGRKENFILHTIFSVLSYLVFGIIPPAVYGFTFRETDDRDLKLVAVAAAALVGILILATVKAFTQGQHNFKTYTKTIGYYVTGAATASGAAYAAGHLLERFMGNLDWFDSNPVENLLIPGNKTWPSI